MFQLKFSIFFIFFFFAICDSWIIMMDCILWWLMKFRDISNLLQTHYYVAVKHIGHYTKETPLNLQNWHHEKNFLHVY